MDQQGTAAMPAAKRARNHPLPPVLSPMIDLDLVCTQLRGRAKVDRLCFIAARAPSLAIPALSAALDAIKADSLDTDLHNAAFRDLSQRLADANLPQPIPDDAWIDKAARTARVETDKLEAELKTYRANSIKESIRMGYNDLGEHLLKCGQFESAAKAFFRAREYASAVPQGPWTSEVLPKTFVHHTFQVLHCHYYMGDHTFMAAQLNKLAPLLEPKADPSAAALAIVFQSLQHLRAHEYKRTAQLLSTLKLADVTDRIETVMAPADIGLVVMHCALATYSRAELKTLLSNDGFRTILDLDPVPRSLLAHFIHSQYAQCLTKLAAHRSATAALDPVLAPHLEQLATLARQRAIAQYCKPFVTVELGQMAAALACADPAALDAEIARLIASKMLPFRIDSRARLLRARRSDPRSTAFAAAMAAGDSLHAARAATLLRVAMVEAGCVIKAASAAGGGGSGSFGSGGGGGDPYDGYFGPGGSGPAGGNGAGGGGGGISTFMSALSSMATGGAPRRVGSGRERASNRLGSGRH
ncbi:26S proteasome subunit RPN7-domain-containing protein [Blastocladiella britannica]|nr:26S proteasome subunit RPN7-domain-containing protein [Blastocladiella britannica]